MINRRLQLSSTARSGADCRHCPGSGNQCHSSAARVLGTSRARGRVFLVGKTHWMGSSLFDRRIYSTYLQSISSLRLSNRATAFFHTRRFPIERVGCVASVPLVREPLIAPTLHEVTRTVELERVKEKIIWLVKQTRFNEPSCPSRISRMWV